MIVIEEIIDRIARRLGLAPEVVRQRNLYRGTGETNRTHYQEDIGGITAFRTSGRSSWRRRNLPSAAPR